MALENQDLQENLNIETDKPQNIQQPTPGGKSFKFDRKKLAILLTLVIAILVPLILLQISSKQKGDVGKNNQSSQQNTQQKVYGYLSGIEINTAYMQVQNLRLEKFHGAPLDNNSKDRINKLREDMLIFSKSNNIDVTEAEIETRIKQLFDATGKEKVLADISKNGWNEDDWREVLRWTILNEKIVLFINPQRTGEVLSIRWDNFTPNLTQEVADTNAPVVKDYLNGIKSDLEGKKIENMYGTYKSFNNGTDSSFRGINIKLEAQYSGWDDNAKKFKEFVLKPDAANYNVLLTTQPGQVSEIICTLGGCNLYHVVSGKNSQEDSLNLIERGKKENYVF